MNITPKLMIVGRTPPPYGGVTVHLSRLTQHLDAEHFPFQFCDLSGRANPDCRFIRCGNIFELMWTLLSKPYEMVHCHASNPWLFLLVDVIVARILRRKTIYTLHGEGNLLLCESGPFILKKMLRGAFKRAARIITINSSCEDRAVQFAASQENVLQMPAYLPPTPSETGSQLYSDDIELFFKNHDICFASQGTFGNQYKGFDLYRFDLLGKALASARTKYPNVGLCTLVSQTLDQTAREKVFSMRRELGLESHWLILENFGAAIPIYLRCVAFIRPTMSDGDSLSVRECLDLSIPVIASNAVPRPEGCILFQCGDLESLEKSLLALLADYPVFLQQAQQSKSSNCLESLLACYRSVLS
ncbi:MAG: glycosyltransferase [Desulfuromonadaceae bacterium]|nr:glycosyltransferase [Desulfuromonadaceae bacterium]MDD2848560.1 glycosyltransferase [Desulfuromonadaceae bacterium]MDD4131538.1 glycosyltransferase [Desulfuromonadaceae bacterium]